MKWKAMNPTAIQNAAQRRIISPAEIATIFPGLACLYRLIWNGLNFLLHSLDGSESLFLVASPGRRDCNHLGFTRSHLRSLALSIFRLVARFGPWTMGGLKGPSAFSLASRFACALFNLVSFLFDNLFYWEFPANPRV